MNAPLSVTPESLHAAAAELRRESARIQAALTELEQRVGVLRDNWDGGAKTSYDAAQRTWSATFSAMRSLLAQVADQTDRRAEDYIARDKQSAQGFTRS